MLTELNAVQKGPPYCSTPGTNQTSSIVCSVHGHLASYGCSAVGQAPAAAAAAAAAMAPVSNAAHAASYMVPRSCTQASRGR